MIWKAVFVSLFHDLTYVFSVQTWKYDLDTVMNITSLILYPDFQIYVTHGYSTLLCYVDVYKLQYIYSTFFMSGKVLEKKCTIYAGYYSYIISVIYNTSTYMTKLRRITIWFLCNGGLPPSPSSCALDVTLDFFMSWFFRCSLKVTLTPKEIKETEIWGCRSLKGKGWRNISVRISTRKIEDVFVMQLWIISLWIVKILKTECSNHIYRITIFELASRIL